MDVPDPAAFWGLDDELARKYTGKGFKLLVFDTGIATTLRCFASREVGKTLLFMNNCDDNNGHGINPCDDKDGHGSFCARISCGDRYEDTSNGKAFKCRGVAPGATLAIWKGYEHGEEGVNKEWTSEWSSQLTQMVDEVGSSVDVVVISSCSEVDNEDAEKAIQELHRTKVIVVCAAGNHGKKDKVNIRFPASFDEVICVGAHDRNGDRCSFSSCDVSTRECDVLALGDDVIGLKLDGSLTKGRHISCRTCHWRSRLSHSPSCQGKMWRNSLWENKKQPCHETTSERIGNWQLQRCTHNKPYGIKEFFL